MLHLACIAHDSTMFCGLTRLLVQQGQLSRGIHGGHEKVAGPRAYLPMRPKSGRCGNIDAAPQRELGCRAPDEDTSAWMRFCGHD